VLSDIKHVVLDSNALLIPFQFKVDIVSEITRLLGNVEIIVPSCVIDELTKIKASEAKAAIKLANKFRVVEASKKGDRGVIEIAKKEHAAVVTNDQELIKILRNSSIPVIRMRECQRLDFA